MSAINTGSINVNYPTPGVNNSSEGFRSNFSSIKTNLDTAGTEITDLQNNVLLKGALQGIPLNNDMNNGTLSNVQTLNFRKSTFALGTNLSGVITIDRTKGDVQYGTVTGNASLNFTKWSPSGTGNSVEVILTVASPSIIITLPGSVTIGTSTIENYSAGSVRVLGSLGLDSPSILHYIFSTTDCGTSIEIAPVNRPRKATQLTTTVPVSSVGVQGDLAGTVAVDSTYIYVCTADYDGISNIWKRVTLTGGAW